jgi:hypothetical protein
LLLLLSIPGTFKAPAPETTSIAWGHSLLPDSLIWLCLGGTGCWRGILVIVKHPTGRPALPWPALSWRRKRDLTMEKMVSSNVQSVCKLLFTTQTSPVCCGFIIPLSGPTQPRLD